MHVKNDEIDQWRKRVEVASEFAVSEVFPQKKCHSGSNNLAVPLHSSDQLRDHDEAYSEAQALLGDWLGNKLRLELEMEDEDDLMCSAGEKSPDASARVQHDTLNYSNFDDLYNCLAEEEEQSAVNSFLQDLMEQEVLDTGMMEELALDVGQTRKRLRDPIVTMEARQLQVRENRARREAEAQRRQREREAKRGVAEEARRRHRGEEAQRKQDARRQEELVQQEMVRLRRQMEEKRGLERLVRQRERERVEGQRSARSLQSAPPLPAKQQQNTAGLHIHQQIQAKVHMSSLKCLQRHFSGWYSVVLDRRLRSGKALALFDWKRKLRAWRAWRAVVWAQQRRREVVRTEAGLRAENRQRMLAAESDRRRLLRQCLSEWQLWCRAEKDQRDLLARQQETRRKMAALIDAASTGQLTAADTSTCLSMTTTPEAESNKPKTTQQEDLHKSSLHSPDAPAALQDKGPAGASLARLPAQPWQVTRRHAALTPAELQQAQRRGSQGGGGGGGGGAGDRHTVQRQIIAQQRRLLKEQQEQIVRLTKEEQSTAGPELEMEKEKERTTQLTRLKGPRPKSNNSKPTEHRVTGEPDSSGAPLRKAITRPMCPHPVITAMEERARQRAERRKEVEELKRQKELEKLVEMKAAEEQRQREEEEEKHQAAEKKRMERRREREKEEEKQRQLKRHQEQLRLARQHYHRNLLLRRGLAPWKRLIELRQANAQLAQSHHRLSLLRRCTEDWQQSAKLSLSEKRTSADQLQQHFLLQRSLSCWKRLKDWRTIQEERAERFHRRRTLRGVLRALLDHVTRERLLDWDRQELAREHDDTRVRRRCLLAWRQLPSQLRRERVKEERRERLGRRVAEVLPDFCSHPL